MLHSMLTGMLFEIIIEKNISSKIKSVNYFIIARLTKFLNIFYQIKQISDLTSLEHNI